MYDRSSIDLTRHFGRVVLQSPEVEHRLPMSFFQEEMRLKQQRREQEALERDRQRSLHRAIQEH